MAPERERRVAEIPGKLPTHRGNLRRFMCYSLLATHRRSERTSSRAHSRGPQTHSALSTPVVAFAPVHRGHRYVYRVANRCLLDAHSTGRAAVCIPELPPAPRVANVRGDTLMTSGRARGRRTAVRRRGARLRRERSKAAYLR